MIPECSLFPILHRNPIHINRHNLWQSKGKLNILTEDSPFIILVHLVLYTSHGVLRASSVLLDIPWNNRTSFYNASTS